MERCYKRILAAGSGYEKQDSTRGSRYNCMCMLLQPECTYEVHGYAGVLLIKAKYDAALDELEKLETKKKQLEDKKVLEAYHNGGKTAEEIIAFIMSGEDKPEEDEKTKKRRKRI